MCSTTIPTFTKFPLPIHQYRCRSIPSQKTTLALLLLGISWSLYFLATTCISARILAKWKIARLGGDDVLVVTSMLVAFPILVITSFGIKYGFGRHTSDIRPEWWPASSKLIYTVFVLGILPFLCTKLSMLYFYLSLAQHPKFRATCYFCIAFVTVVCSVLTLISVFGCAPISGGWNYESRLDASCITTKPFYYTIAISNLITDMFVMLLPIPILLQLKQRTRVKVTLVVMFSMGFLVTGASVYFIYTLHHTLNSMDSAWDLGYCWMVATIEHSVGVMTACMPGVFVFIRWVRGDVLDRGVGGKAVYHESGGDGTIGTRWRQVAEDLELGGTMHSTEGLVGEPLEAL